MDGAGHAAAPLHDIAEGPAGGTAWWAGAADGVRIRLAHWPGTGRGTVLLFPGRTEYVEKYGRTAVDLTAAGLDVLTIDWRGQGLSGRLIENAAIGHVEDFRNYQMDVAQLLLAARGRGLPEPWLVLAHSMGGAIALRALKEGLPAKGVVLTAPMLGLGVTAMRRALAWGIGAAARRLRQDHRLTPGVSALNYVLNVSFEDNDLTSDAEQFAWLRRQMTLHPELSLGGPSLRWLTEAMREMAWLRRIPPPELPAVLAVGSDERIVQPSAVHAMAARWPGARLDLYDGARHEILLETPAHRARLLASLLTLMG